MSAKKWKILKNMRNERKKKDGNRGLVFWSGRVTFDSFVGGPFLTAFIIHLKFLSCPVLSGFLSSAFLPIFLVNSAWLFQRV